MQCHDADLIDEVFEGENHSRPVKFLGVLVIERELLGAAGCDRDAARGPSVDHIGSHASGHCYWSVWMRRLELRLCSWKLVRKLDFSHTVFVPTNGQDGLPRQLV